MTALRRPETEAMRRPDQTSVQTRKGFHRTERTPVQHTELRLTKHWILFGGSQQAAFYEHLKYVSKVMGQMWALLALGWCPRTFETYFICVVNSAG